nr:hypothetical protein BaRGS_023000 [Batillaria attramentaria]
MMKPRTAMVGTALSASRQQQQHMQQQLKAVTQNDPNVMKELGISRPKKEKLLWLVQVHWWDVHCPVA